MDPNPAGNDMSTVTITLICLFPLIAWRVYRRIRRNIGRQRSTRARHWIGIGLYSVLLLLLGLHSLSVPESLLSLAGGVAIGIALAILGLRLTKFERTPEGYFYTPSAHIGIALTLLFVGRICYRIVELYLRHPLNGAPPDFARSPLTLIVFGMLAGYFVVYAIGVLLWRTRHRRIPPENSNAGAGQVLPEKAPEQS